MRNFLLIVVLLCLVNFPTVHSARLGPFERGQQGRALRLPLKNPRIVVMKGKRRMELHADGSIVRIYQIGLGLNPVPDKVRQGDRATPEGDFYVFTKNNKSAFYLSLGISYPNVEDAERGLRDGLISRTSVTQSSELSREKPLRHKTRSWAGTSTFTETVRRAIGHGAASH